MIHDGRDGATNPIQPVASFAFFMYPPSRLSTLRRPQSPEGFGQGLLHRFIMLRYALFHIYKQCVLRCHRRADN
jgi:hypothetical protein